MGALRAATAPGHILPVLPSITWLLRAASWALDWAVPCPPSPSEGEKHGAAEWEPCLVPHVCRSVEQTLAVYTPEAD